jgi:hypothetical protein
MPDYALRSGQINFESNSNSGSHACVVIKNGEFHNLTQDLRQILLDALQVPEDKEVINLEDMF